MKIQIFDDRPSGFWVLMGPYFASQQVKRALPYLHDDPSRVWFVATNRGAVVGFGAVSMRGEMGELHSLYVVPESRGGGVARALAETREKYLISVGAKKITVTANGQSRPLWESLGYVAARKKGQYSVLVKEINP